MPIPATPVIRDDVMCSALLLALVASEVRRAWHAGVIDADTAMRRLDGFLSELCSSTRRGDHLPLVERATPEGPPSGASGFDHRLAEVHPALVNALIPCKEVKRMTDSWFAA